MTTTVTSLSTPCAIVGEITEENVSRQQPPRGTASLPQRDWYQSGRNVTMVVYLKESVNSDAVVVEADADMFNVAVDAHDFYYRVMVAPYARIVPRPVSVRVRGKTLTITLATEEAAAVPPVKWPVLGTVLLEECSPADGSSGGLSGYHDCTVTRVLRHNHDTLIVRVRYPDSMPTAACHIPIGRHVRVRATIDEQQVARSYTPIVYDTDGDAATPGGDDSGGGCVASISADSALRTFDLMVKVYQNGLLSSHLGASMQAGSTISCTRAAGSFVYQPGKYRRIGMIAGGTGIAPMQRILREATARHHHQQQQPMPPAIPEFFLVFCNHCQEDILLRDELEQIGRADNVHIHHVLSQPPQPSLEGAQVTRVSLRVSVCAFPLLLTALSIAALSRGVFCVKNRHSGTPGGQVVM
jgi:ferredoxin-NADP reductase